MGSRWTAGTAARRATAVRARAIGDPLGGAGAPSAIGFLERHRSFRPSDQGVAISTFGKVIKRGWDWLGVAPRRASMSSGLIEVPDLAACLTLSKNDFIRTGSRGATYLAYRKAIQEVVSRQLAAWGDTRDAEVRPRTVRLERDLERVLEDLADDFPLLRSLVDHRAGGQKRLPMPGRGKEQVPAPLFANLAAGGDSGGEGQDCRPPQASRGHHPRRGPRRRRNQRPFHRRRRLPQRTRRGPNRRRRIRRARGAGADTIGSTGTLDTVVGRRRPARYGLLVQFESRPGDSELGRLVDSTIWINDAHPAFTRATVSRSVGYHTALAVALALAPLAVEASRRARLHHPVPRSLGQRERPHPAAPAAQGGSVMSRRGQP